MEIRSITILLINFCLLSMVVSLKCRCKGVKCINKTEDECPVGIVNDPCLCCAICAKNVGETCGGFFNFNGVCGRGLECVTSTPSDHHYHAPMMDAIGICQKKM